MKQIPSVIFFENATSPSRAGRGKRRLWAGHGEFVIAQWADDSVRPQTAPDFFEILGEFATAQWDDVGIGPYNEMGKCLRFRRKFSKTRCFLPGGAEPRPYQGLGKIALLCRF